MKPKTRYYIKPIFGEEYETTKASYYMEKIPYIIFSFLGLIAIIFLLAFIMLTLFKIITNTH